jgi:hypothetical protein
MSATFLSDKTVKARKSYKCELCALPINQGESHYAQRMIWEGQACTWRAHTDCNELTKDWHQDDYEYNDPHEFRKLLEKPKGVAG